MAVITIIGAGMMGSGMSRPARDNGHEVRLVGTPLDREIINEASRSSRHIPMKRILPEGIKYFQTEDVRTALAGCDLVICGVSSFGVDWFASEILPILPVGVPVLSVTKGIRENSDGYPQYFPDFFAESLPEEKQGKILFNAIGGPCTSYELMDRHQTMVFFCGKDIKTLKYLRSLLATDYYHINISTDTPGVEMCVALKNAYAVAVSMAIGMGEKIDGPDAYMYNPQAAVFGQSIREMNKLTGLFGGNPSMAGDLPGAGDLFVTIFGGRTRKLGILLGLGKSYKEAAAELKGVTLESVVIITRISKILRQMAAKNQVNINDYPLILFLDSVINDGAPTNIPWQKFC